MNGYTWSKDGRWLASASLDKTVKVWDTVTGQETIQIPYETRPGDAIWVRIGEDQRHLQLPQNEQLLMAERDPVAWSPDGQWLAVACPGHGIALWDIAKRRLILTLDGHKGPVRSLAWHPSGLRLASGSTDGTVRVWDIDKGQAVLTLFGHDGWVHTVNWSPEGLRLASGGDDQTIKVWDATTGAKVLTLCGHKEAVVRVEWLPDGTHLFSTARDKTAKIWDTTNQPESLSLENRVENKFGNWAPYLGWLSNREVVGLVEGRETNVGLVWDAATGEDVPVRPEETDELTKKASIRNSNLQTALSADARRSAWLGNPSSLILIGDGTTRESVSFTLRGHVDMVSAMAWSPDGQRLASGSYDNTVKVWDAMTGEELITLRGHTSYVVSVAWSPDGRGLVSASRDGIIKLWDTHKRGIWRPSVAIANNDLAWQSATYPDPRFRDVQRAVQMAKQATELKPLAADFWNTQGVVQYRAGDWNASVESVMKSVQLNPDGGTSFDWFFLAMAHWQLGQKEQARKWYEKAVEWMKQNRPDDDGLRRFRKEAAALLGIEDPPPANEKDAPTPKPQPRPAQKGGRWLQGGRWVPLPP